MHVLSLLDYCSPIILLWFALIKLLFALLPPCLPSLLLLLMKFAMLFCLLPMLPVLRDFIPYLSSQILPQCFQPITTFINLSLSEGIFPDVFKHAIVTPLHKQHSLPKDELSSYRPI